MNRLNHSVRLLIISTLAMATFYSGLIVQAATFQGDGTYTIKDGDIVRLNNGHEILVKYVTLVNSEGVEVDYAGDLQLELLKPTNVGEQNIQPGGLRQFKAYDTASILEGPISLMKDSTSVSYKTFIKEKSEVVLSFKSEKELTIFSWVMIILFLITVSTFMVEIKSKNFSYRNTLTRSLRLSLLYSFCFIIIAIFYLPSGLGHAGLDIFSVGLIIFTPVLITTVIISFLMRIILNKIKKV